jgi:class 3 adenylate cyclase/tetratricopeptide (TPR) repeat protein
VASERSCPACGAELFPASGAEEFRVITVVFCDIVDSMKLNEHLETLPLRRVMDRFYETAHRILAGHGGAVGARYGDGLMAVFGIPTPHDDDALRAVRAAWELQQALSQLSAQLESSHNVALAARIGVNTGRVLVQTEGTSVEDQVTGHDVNLARRFEQNAGPGGILIGEATYSLVRDAVRAEQTDPLRLKGVPELVVGYRVHLVMPGVPGRARRLDRPLIGRDLEQRLLMDLFERTVAERSCHLVVLLGPGGIGKSRLVDHFVQDLGDQATILRGHCLSYGESTTFWPIMEIVNQAAGIAPTDPLDVVYERLGEPLADSDRAREITLRVAQLIGFAAESGLPGDSYSALRAFLEALARRRPLVVFVDDLHWAEPSLLDAIDHIAEYSQDVPLMLLCVARPEELLKRRERWPGAKPNILCVSLSPLRESEGEKLVEHLLDGKRLDVEVMAYIWQLTDGNPLYLEELVEGLVQRGILRPIDGRWVATASELDNVALPRTIEALLTVRLARLSEQERSIIERASVVGKQFHTADIVALSPEMQPSQVADCLETLRLQDLIDRDHKAVFPLPAVEGGDGYSFRHILIRNAAYERMTEEVRADRHRRYANWVEETAGDRLSQFDELIAYHLNEAYEYLRKLGPPDADARKLARRGGERFAAAGRRAVIRGDIRLTLALLRRASRLLPHDDPSRIAVLSDLADALQATGELQRAGEVYDELTARAEAAGRDAEALHATLGRLQVLAVTDLSAFLRDARREAERAISVFTRTHDNLGLAKAWHVLAQTDWVVGRSAEASTAAARARGFAQGASDRSQEAKTIRLYCQVLLSGEASVVEVTERAQQALTLARTTGLRSLEASMLTTLAQTAAMAGDFDSAREHSKEGSAVALELGELLTRAADSAREGLVLLLQEEPADAEETLRKGYGALERMGATTPQASIAVLLARVFLHQGRYGEAEEMIEVCGRLAAADHVDIQVKRQSVRAILLAHRGKLEEAERSARLAVELAETTDQLDTLAQAHADLAAILRIATQREEAIQELERALRLYRRKGNDTGVRAVRRELINLRR